MTIVTLPPTGKIYRVPAPHVFAGYYFAGAQRVAVRERYPQGFDADKMSYLLSDHLGSTSVTASGTEGSKISALRYKPRRAPCSSNP